MGNTHQRQPLAVALAKHGGDRRSPTVKAEAAGKADQGDNVTLKERGNSAEYLTARLDRDRPDIAAKFCGKFCYHFRSVRGDISAHLQKAAQFHQKSWLGSPGSFCQGFKPAPSPPF